MKDNTRPPSRIGGSNKLISMHDAAGYLGVSYYTLKDNYLAWGIPVYRVGRNVKFRERDLVAWIESKRVTLKTSMADATASELLCYTENVKAIPATVRI